MPSPERPQDNLVTGSSQQSRETGRSLTSRTTGQVGERGRGLVPQPTDQSGTSRRLSPDTQPPQQARSSRAESRGSAGSRSSSIGDVLADVVKTVGDVGASINRTASDLERRRLRFATQATDAISNYWRPSSTPEERAERAVREREARRHRSMQEEMQVLGQVMREQERIESGVSGGSGVTGLTPREISRASAAAEAARRIMEDDSTGEQSAGRSQSGDVFPGSGRSSSEDQSGSRGQSSGGA